MYTVFLCWVFGISFGGSPIEIMQVENIKSTSVILDLGHVFSSLLVVFSFWEYIRIVVVLRHTSILLPPLSSLVDPTATWPVIAANFNIILILISLEQGHPTDIVSVEYLFGRPIITSDIWLGKCHLELS